MLALRTLAGLLIGALVRGWLWTLRVRVVGGEEPARARVLAFWHGEQMLLLGARRRPTAALVSWSRDGALQAGVMRALSLSVVRGSSSRGGAAGLRALVAHVARGLDAAFAVDGPRGPRGVAKPGAAFAARVAGVPLLPVAAAASRVRVLGRAWDRFLVPLPFANVVVCIGEPVDADAALAEPRVLEGAIAAAGRQAQAALDAGHVAGTPGSPA